MELINTSIIDKKYREVVFELLVMLRTHSEESYLHSVNVANKAHKIAKALNIDQEGIKNLYVAGLLHDIGKTCVDRKLLHKSNATPKEQEIIRFGHIEGTKRILNQCFADEDFVRLAVHHHERLNCSGYPEHLKANDLDVLDRILQVADVTSALEMCRSYKEAYDAETVISILENLVKRGELDKKCVKEAKKIIIDEQESKGQKAQ